MATGDVNKDDLTSVSREVFDIMNYIGYSPPMVKERRKIYQEKEAMFSKVNQEFTLITAGSKGEGLTSSFESDYDRLRTYRDIVCIYPNTRVNIFTSKTIVYMNGTNCHPGHFVLTLSRRGSKTFKPIEYALVSDKHVKNQISSHLFFYFNDGLDEVYESIGWELEERAGPAITSDRGIYHRDDVFAFRCLSQKAILKQWATRARRHSWPSRQIIEEILQLEAQLVPVGCAGSENKSMEWRICFIPGEMRLCESLNETQYKLYILLKMVNKYFLKPICSDMSSFMMKNITFWITETNPSELFCRENLLLVLKLGLDMLIESLKNKCLPYFMIPARNLFIGRQCLSSSYELISKLKEISADCSRVIFGLPKFQVVKKGLPIEKLIEDGHKRDTLESLELKRHYIIASYTEQGLTENEIGHAIWKDNSYRETQITMYDMVWPDWRQYFESEKPKCSLETHFNTLNVLPSTKNQYRSFVRRYFDIMWPHVRQYMKGYNGIPKDEIIDFLALLRVKTEIALS